MLTIFLNQLIGIEVRVSSGCYNLMSISTSIANDKLSDLRLKKKIAIQTLDFDAAEEFDMEILAQNEQITNNLVNKIKSEIIKETEVSIAKFDKIKREIEEFRIRSQNQLTNSYHESIDKVVLQNEKEIKNLEKSHCNSLLREAERPVTQQIEILERAKKLATEGHYQEAKQLREDARNVGENELQMRKEKVDSEFAQSRVLLTAKQQESLDQIAILYENETEKLNMEIQTRTIESEARFQKRIELIKEKARVRCDTLVQDETIKEKSIFEITQSINDILLLAQAESPGSKSRRSALSTSR